MSSRDQDLFRQTMGDVRRLGDDDRISRRPPPAGAAEIARRAAAVARPGNGNPLTVPEQVTLIGPHDLVGRKKDGVQEGVYRKLRLGKYTVQASLDLHRVLVSDACERVHRFLRDSHSTGLRTVLVTHGKGHHSPTPGRMKSYVIHWLEESDLALAYHSARPNQGGAGATYVLLRKSAEQKQATRERFREPPRHQRQ